MVTNMIPNPRRIRNISESFGFIQHRFLRDGFLSILEKNEVVLYFFWVLAADRHGISYYGDVRICKLLGLSKDELQTARTGLIQKDLVGWEKPWVQVLELPVQPVVDGLAPRSPHSFKALRQKLES
ncbi:MAG: hypothetical protein HQ517_08585 [SAR324 cluster bacterium]|nr:hypothetical protein [SAR324 cluster bacterium]